MAVGQAIRCLGQNGLSGVLSGAGNGGEGMGRLGLGLPLPSSPGAPDELLTGSWLAGRFAGAGRRGLPLSATRYRTGTALKPRGGSYAMTLIRTIVTHGLINDAPADWASAAVYHTSASDFPLAPGTDWDNHCQQVLDCFAGHSAGYEGANLLTGRSAQARCYDMADAEPRPIKAQKTYTPGVPDQESEMAPRQMALCLSYYADRNLPSQRGRIYVGPLKASAVSFQTPPTATQNAVLALGHALFDVGGENVAWVVRSQKHNTTHVITDCWVDNSWDVIRSRKLKPSSRVRLHP